MSQSDLVCCEALKLVPAKWCGEFFRFIETGEASNEFLEFLEIDESCREACEMVFRGDEEMRRLVAKMVQSEDAVESGNSA